MPHTVDECPWCESVISRSRHMEIEAMTRRQQKTKLSEVLKQLRVAIQAPGLSVLDKSGNALHKQSAARSRWPKQP
jgi:hypothetical protein